MTQQASRFALVVFDVAGTTVDDGDAVVDCMRTVLAPYAEVPVDCIRQVMGLPKPQAIAQLLSSQVVMTDDGLCAAVAECHDRFRAALISRYGEPGAVVPVSGAPAVFAALRDAGIRIALDTGFSRDILDTILQALHWNGPTVDCTVASDEVSRGRPYPDLILRAMELTGVTDAQTVVKVGDTPADIDQGFAAGCGLVVGVTCGTHTRDELERDGAVLIARLPDLLPLLGVSPA